MIHGGARYCSDTGTTKHSCVDSGYVQNIAKHLLFEFRSWSLSYVKQLWSARSTSLRRLL